MVNKTKCKLYKGNGSYIISLKKSFIEDSGCDFKEGDTLEICMVERDKIIIYKDDKNKESDNPDLELDITA